MVRAPKNPEDTPDQPAMVDVLQTANPSFGVPAQLSTAALEGAMEPDTNDEGLDYGVQARLDTLLNNGFPEDEARRMLGILPPLPQTTELPPWPKLPEKRRKRITVRDPGGEGRAASDRIAQETPTPEGAVALADVREKYSTPKATISLPNNLKKAREQLREFNEGHVYKITFRPLSRFEMDAIRVATEDQDTNVSIRIAYNKALGRTAGLSDIGFGKRLQKADATIKSKLNVWGDLLEDSRVKFSLLKKLSTSLLVNDSHTPHLGAFLAEAKKAGPVQAQESYDAVRALVQDMDLTALVAEGTTLVMPFDPLRGHEDREHPSRPGANKRIYDAYTNPENAEKVREYILARAKEVSADEALRYLPGAIDRHDSRGHFYRNILEVVDGNVKYHELGAEVFAAVGIGRPE